MKRFFLAAFTALVLCPALFATPDADAIFRTDIPVYLGEKLFCERLGIPVPGDGNSREAGVYRKQGDDNGRKAPLGLVFSGGAARAFAHIGVLRKLEEEGIYPDFIVANSMGSIVALLYAAGASPDMIEKMITEYPTDSLFRPEIPLNGGVLDTSRFTSMLYRVLGDLDIKDLEIPVAIVSEDLESRRQIVFMEGDFYRILQASISMPFSFPPVNYRGMTLIDGGVTNLVPVDIAAGYTDRILVSTALYNRESEYRNFMTIINRAFDIGKTRKGISQLKHIDSVLIRCDVENFSFMDFQKMDLIIDRGYDSAADKIDELEAAGFDRGIIWDDAKLLELSSCREKLDERFDAVTAAYKRTGMVPQRELSGRMFAGFEMYSGIRDDYYLDNSDYVYLGQSAEIGYLQAGLREYYAPGADAGAGLDGRVDFSLFELLVFKNRLMAQWENYRYDKTLLYSRVDLNLTTDGESGIRPFLARESGFGRDMGKGEQESFTRGGLELYTGEYLFSSYWFNESSETNGIGLENDFRIKLAGKFYLDQRTVFRNPLEGESEIPLYRNDGLRGYEPDGYFERVLLTNNSLTFRTDTSLSFGEILLVKNLAASAFCDYFRPDENGISAGLALDLEVSFIGLTSLYFTAYAGYDYLYDRMFSSVVIGNGR